MQILNTVLIILLFLSLVFSLVCQEKHWFPKLLEVDNSSYGSITLETVQNSSTNALKDTSQPIIEYLLNHSYNKKKENEESSEKADSVSLKTIENYIRLNQKETKNNDDIREENKLSDVSDTITLI